jgi:hypothetical protein
MRQNSVDQGSWCPKCMKYVNEQNVRLIFNKIFNDIFSKTKPYWLKNSRGNKMELDGYNERLGIAFEYHGEQHYKKHKFFNKTSVTQRKKDDIQKRKLCKQNGVVLIEIPYWINKDDIEKYIKHKLLKHNINTQQKFFIFD